MGRGVFATKRIRNGKIIEVCPVMTCGSEHTFNWKGANIENYVFGWGEDVCIALGYGSLYNHSHLPNAAVRRDMKKREITFYALKNIAKGEQVFIDYGWDDYDWEIGIAYSGFADA